VAGAFFALSIATLHDFGITWDEGVKIHDEEIDKRSCVSRDVRYWLF
jgi:hypothetical protein